MQFENVRHSIVDLFKCPLYRNDYFLEDSVKKKIIDQFLEIEKNEPMPRGKYPEGGYTSFNTRQHIFNIDELEGLKKHILTSAKALHQYVGLEGDLRLSNSWFSINRKGTYHEAHHHCPNIWSGVYYLEADNFDATISFINKNLVDTSWPFSANKSIITEYIGSEKVCKVSSGMMILFPSYLWHKVSQQNLEKDRITIAFNLDIKNESSI
jgi:uncharacterized protein (TIGR02466 family)